MTWISTIPFEQADPVLREVYERLLALYPADYAIPVPSLTRADGQSDGVVAAHSLIPEAMGQMMGGYAALLRPELPLTRRQHEIIATVVSAQNSCFF